MSLTLLPGAHTLMSWCSPPCSVALVQPFSLGCTAWLLLDCVYQTRGEKTMMTHSCYLKAAVQIASPACHSSPSIPPLALKWYHSYFNLFVLSVGVSHITSYQPWLLSEQELDSCLQAMMLSLLIHSLTSQHALLQLLFAFLTNIAKLLLFFRALHKHRGGDKGADHPGTTQSPTELS